MPPLTEVEIQIAISRLIDKQDATELELADTKERGERALVEVRDRCEAAIADLKKEHGEKIAAMQLERDQALKWGVMSLGTAVLLMGGWISKLLFTGGIKW